MSIPASKFAVRIAAIISVLICGYFLTFILAKFLGESAGQSRTGSGEVLFVGISSILPVLFIWASVRAWRFLPKGIESLSAIWALAGLSDVFYGLILGYGDGWKIRNVIEMVVGLFLFFFGVWMSRQQKRLYEIA